MDLRVAMRPVKDAVGRHRWSTNAEVPGPVLRRRFRLPRAVTEPIAAALHRGMVTARGADRTLRLAWTVADLAGRDRPLVEDVSAAMGLRDRRAA
ncbi:MAG TPA: hypothetical protein VIH64_10450 [Streptosporangiaceae bacterium]